MSSRPDPIVGATGDLCGTSQWRNACGNPHFVGLLTDCFAYKLKKPVRFDFVDFSTVELRRRACEEEVRLNRRLATGCLLGNRGRASRFARGTVARRESVRLLEAGRGDAAAWAERTSWIGWSKCGDSCQPHVVELHRSNRLTDLDLERSREGLPASIAQAMLSEHDPREFCDEIERHVRGEPFRTCSLIAI